MSLDPGSLLASMFVSGIGFALLNYGRKCRRMPHAAIGLVMLVYPYVVPDVGLMLGIMAALLALLWGGTKLLGL